MRRLQTQDAVPSVREKAFISDLAVSLLLICRAPGSKLRYKLIQRMPISHTWSSNRCRFSFLGYKFFLYHHHRSSISPKDPLNKRGSLLRKVRQKAKGESSQWNKAGCFFRDGGFGLPSIHLHTEPLAPLKLSISAKRRSNTWAREMQSAKMEFLKDSNRNWVHRGCYGTRLCCHKAYISGMATSFPFSPHSPRC